MRRTAAAILGTPPDDAGELLERVLTDARSVPALARYLDEEWEPLLDWLVDTLAAGWEVRGAGARRLRATRGWSTAGTVAVVALRSNAAGADEYDGGPAHAEPAYDEAA